jgi:molecular chaperone GrpE (heat shock protein)
VFTTAEDMQPSVEIHVLQGEREMVELQQDARQVPARRPAARPARRAADRGHLRHRRQRHRPRVGQGPGHEQGAVDDHHRSVVADKDEIDQMVRDAEAHAEEDRQRREEAEVRNTADTLVYQTEKVLREQGDKVSADDKQFKDIALRLQADFENYRKRVATQQADEIDRATGKIAEALLPVLDACEAAFAHQVRASSRSGARSSARCRSTASRRSTSPSSRSIPAVAEAVMHEPGTDGADGPVVAEVLRTGYRWKGRSSARRWWSAADAVRG